MVEWQTRTFEGRVGKPVRVQLPPSAPNLFPVAVSFSPRDRPVRHGHVRQSQFAVQAGVVEFLSKPVEPEKLVAAVHKAVKESGYKDDHTT